MSRAARGVGGWGSHSASFTVCPHLTSSISSWSLSTIHWYRRAGCKRGGQFPPNLFSPSAAPSDAKHWPFSGTASVSHARELSELIPCTRRQIPGIALAEATPIWTLRRAHARVRAREKSLKNFDPVPNFRETIFFLAVSQTRTSGSALGLVAAAYSSVTRIAFSAAASLKNERARLQPARRPRRGHHHGGNDLSGTGASSCVRRAEHSRDSLSAGHGADLRRAAGPDAPWPRSVAAAARRRRDRPAGRGLMPLASSTQVRAARLPPSLVVLDFRNGVKPSPRWFGRSSRWPIFSAVMVRPGAYRLSARARKFRGVVRFPGRPQRRNRSLHLRGR